MEHRNKIKQWINLGLMSVLAAISSQALASGFQLFEYNGVAAGDAGAGGAAIAEDASTSFINPAGLTRLKKPQFVIAGTQVISKTQFEGVSTYNSLGLPVSKQGISKGGDSALIPAFYYSAPINPNVVFGFGISVPFGLSTQYSDKAFTRYSATVSELNAMDITPSIGYKVNDQLSLGFGIDIQKLNATLDSFAGLSPSAKFDSSSHNQASDWGYGWHIGGLYEFTPATRVGLSYRSQAVFHPAGTSTLTGPLTFTGSPISGDALRSDITLPAMSTLSVYHDVNNRLALMGSVNYTQWNVVKSITLYNVVSAFGNLVNATLPENFRNTWRFAVGTNYKVDPKWMVRAGVAYDQTPTVDADRNIRLPDGDRTLLALGVRYQATNTVGIDLGYTHIFMKDGLINATTNVATSKVTNVGTSKNSADLIGAQVTWNLG